VTIKRILAVLFTASLLILSTVAPAQTKAAPATATKSTVQKPPQPGMVWANTKSKIYHKDGDQWYGKGKNGTWMTEADAKKGGYRIASANAVTAKPNSKGATGSTGTTGKK